jgi:hypothetical protein
METGRTKNIYFILVLIPCILRMNQMVVVKNLLSCMSC